MVKQLKKWKGGMNSGKYKNMDFYVAAYSRKEAAEIVSTITGNRITESHIKIYCAMCWGNAMNGIEPTEPCLYVNKKFAGSDTVQKLFPIKQKLSTLQKQALIDISKSVSYFFNPVTVRSAYTKDSFGDKAKKVSSKVIKPLEQYGFIEKRRHNQFIYIFNITEAGINYLK